MKPNRTTILSSLLSLFLIMVSGGVSIPIAGDADGAPSAVQKLFDDEDL